MKNLKNILLSLMLVVGVASAEAGSSHYFDPNNPGHGVSKTYDSGQGSAFIWYLYNREGEGRWLTTTENCHAYPCDVDLSQAFGKWMGGDVELVKVGSVTISFAEDKLIWDYDLRFWPESGECGRMIWTVQTKCVGQFSMIAVD